MTRGGLVESVHVVDVVVLDPDGAVRVAAGTVDESMLPRSALKPAQAVAVLEAGADLDDAELALASASHSGEDLHLAGVAALLRRHGLSVTPSSTDPQLLAAVERVLLDATPKSAKPVREHPACTGQYSLYDEADVA